MTQLHVQTSPLRKEGEEGVEEIVILHHGISHTRLHHCSLIKILCCLYPSFAFEPVIHSNPYWEIEEVQKIYSLTIILRLKSEDHHPKFKKQKQIQIVITTIVQNYEFASVLAVTMLHNSLGFFHGTFVHLHLPPSCNWKSFHRVVLIRDTILYFFHCPIKMEFFCSS